jgi:Zn-dependent protease with chaperone function
MTRVSPTVLLALPATAVAVLVVALLAIAGVPVWLAALLAVTIGVLVGLALRRRAPRVALERLGASPIDPADEPRLANIVEGLCVTHGFPEPELYRVDSESLNAAVVGRSPRDACLVVTDGLIRSLDRLELEAVVARVLSPIEDVESGTVLVSVAAALSPPGLRDRLLEWALDHRSIVAIDLDAVRLTRYPPALASAYEKAAEVRALESTPIADHLWLLGTADGRTRGVVHPSLSDRIDVLREL